MRKSKKHFIWSKKKCFYPFGNELDAKFILLTDNLVFTTFCEQNNQLFDNMLQCLSSNNNPYRAEIFAKPMCSEMVAYSICCDLQKIQLYASNTVIYCCFFLCFLNVIVENRPFYGLILFGLFTQACVSSGKQTNSTCSI